MKLVALRTSDLQESAFTASSKIVGMHPIVINKRADLVELCRKRGVQRLGPSGSAARDDFDRARRDLNILVAFDANHPHSSLSTAGWRQLLRNTEGSSASETCWSPAVRG